MAMVGIKDKLLLMSQEMESLGHCFSKCGPETPNYPQYSFRESARSKPFSSQCDCACLLHTHSLMSVEYMKGF